MPEKVFIARHYDYTEDEPDHLLADFSPLGWKHVNLTGDYVWAA